MPVKTNIETKKNPEWISYKDVDTGIEFVTKEQCEDRISSMNVPGCLATYYYIHVGNIHPRYLEKLPATVKERRDDLYAISPVGFVWKEEESTTSYFHWDEWYVLVALKNKAKKTIKT